MKALSRSLSIDMGQCASLFFFFFFWVWVHFYFLAIIMLVTILASECCNVRVCVSFAKCCLKIKEDEEVRRRRCR